MMPGTLSPEQIAPKTNLITEFCKLQRASVTAEIAVAKGQLGVAEVVLVEMNRIGDLIIKTLKEHNVGQEKPQDNPVGPIGPTKEQSGNATVVKRRRNATKKRQIRQNG